VGTDFESCDWRSVVEEADAKRCEMYFSLFFAKAKKADEDGDGDQAVALRLLGSVASLRLNPESASEPLLPMMVMGGRRSAVLDDFDSSQMDLLAGVMPSIEDAELRARVADVVWVKRRDFEAAELAVLSYLASAQNLENPEEWSPCAYRIERAFRIAVSLGNNREPLDRVVTHIESVLERRGPTDRLFLSARMMDLLLECGRGDSKRYADLCETLARKAVDDLRWYVAREYWEKKARWHRTAKEYDAERGARTEIARVHSDEAEAALAKSPPSYMTAAIHQRDAVEALRRAGVPREVVQEAHKKLLEYQKKSTAELHAFSSGFDASDIVRDAIELVKGRTFEDALVVLALIAHPSSVGALRSHVERQAQELFFVHHVPAMLLDKEGKVTGRMPGVHSEPDEDAEKLLLAHMFKHAVFEYGITAQCRIAPAAERIALEHEVEARTFLPIVSNNPMVPEGREYVYARGLYAGLKGDLLEATHLLIPQFENSVRFVLEQCGVITSGLDADGIQEVHDLNRTLRLPETCKAFGEDTTFALRTLLVERSGSNLRNRMAHGLMAHEEFFSYETFYLWWLILRLCAAPLIKAAKQPECSQQDPASEQDTSKRDEDAPDDSEGPETGSNGSAT